MTVPGTESGKVTVRLGPPAVPPGVTTVTAPVAATAVLKMILVGEITVNLVLATVELPILTDVAPHRLVPVMVTAIPLAALTKFTEVTEGSAFADTAALGEIKPD